MARAKMRTSQWKKRPVREFEKPVFIFETNACLTGAAKKSLLESIKKQIKEGVVLVDSKTTCVYAGDFKTIMIAD